MLRNDALLLRATHTIRPILRSRELRMRYRTKRRKCKKNSALPPRGKFIQNRQFRLREGYQNFTSPQAEILYLFRFTVPFGEMHIKIFIPPSREYDLEFRRPAAAAARRRHINSFCHISSAFLHSIFLSVEQ